MEKFWKDIKQRNGWYWTVLVLLCIILTCCIITLVVQYKTKNYVETKISPKANEIDKTIKGIDDNVKKIKQAVCQLPGAKGTGACIDKFF